MGGIKRILLNLFANVVAPVVDAVSGKILTVSIEQGADKFVEIQVPKDVANLVSTLNANPQNGSNYIQNVLTIAVNRMDTAKRMAISALAVSELAAIIVDNNNKAWYIGKDEPLTANGGESGTGTAKADRNGYGLTLQSEELSYPHEIDEAFDLSTIIA